VIAKIGAVDIAFLDPPYPLEQEYERSLTALADDPPGITIAQHSSRFALEESYGVLKRARVLKQGDSSLSFFAA
jgi:16S rRNA G966 N2-methylase RsmD